MEISTGHIEPTSQLPTSPLKFKRNDNVLSKLSPYQIQKHKDIRAKLLVEAKVGPPDLEEEVKRYFRSPLKKVYSRGHEIHEAGAELAPRPLGTSPIVSRVRFNGDFG